MITPLRILEMAVKFFEKNRYRYCLAGGHAASLYREHERLTRDVDFALVARTKSESRKLAEAAIEGIGLKPAAGFIAKGPGEKARRTVCMITSQPLKNETEGIIDILLPELPWVEQAVDRAQHNKINLRFAVVPVITPEDLVLAKCYSLRNAPDRFQDLDDLKEIFLSVKDLDFPYIRNGLAQLEISIPAAVRKFAAVRSRKR